MAFGENLWHRLTRHLIWSCRFPCQCDGADWCFSDCFSFPCIMGDDLYDAALLLPPPLSPILCQTTRLQINLTRLSELSVYYRMPGTDNRALQVHCRLPLVRQAPMWQLPRTRRCSSGRISMSGHLEMKVVFLILISIASLFSLGLNQSGNGLHCPAALCRANCIGTSKWENKNGTQWDFQWLVHVTQPAIYAIWMTTFSALRSQNPAVLEQSHQGQCKEISNHPRSHLCLLTISNEPNVHRWRANPRREISKSPRIKRELGTHDLYSADRRAAHNKKCFKADSILAFME